MSKNSKRPMNSPRPGLNKEQKKHILKRLFTYFKPYKWLFFVVAVCIAISAIVGVTSSLFLQVLIDDYISPLLLEASPVFSGLAKALVFLAGIYLFGVIVTFTYNRIMAIVSQKIMKDIRDDMFVHMQTLPIKYFDSHTHGELMSYYINDTDTLVQMLAQSLPQILSSTMSIIAVFVSMLSVSIWLTLLVIVLIFPMLFIVKFIAGKSGKFFGAQQASIAEVNGFVEEMINGQKVIKVFCHEEASKADFDEKNNFLCQNSTRAHKYANVLMPLINNLGHCIYVLVAIIGGALAISGFSNISLAGVGVLTVGMIASFLTLTRNFINPISQVSQQMNSIIMAIAGAGRIFSLIDEPSEMDNGYVSLVNAEIVNGEIKESINQTNVWAWKHPHGDGSVTYTLLKGDVVLENVKFGYVPNKPVLFDVSLHALSGQKFAFVGATGAGKTTITNLINRFYDLDSGKIRYDGININKIKKPDLRKSLGMVLQDVNLFTGTVMENIRYGNLDASDEDCINAAKLANAHNFIEMLPKGYQTILEGDGSGLSQGQRQLISIARAAVCNPPVMVLDEATSSIDTRTESLVQEGMDALMQGRTVFVIAHRLSTVQNSDNIIVLDHGKIIERGNHNELIARKGQYYQLYTGAFELE